MSFNRNRNETEVKFRLDFLESEARLYNIHNLILITLLRIIITNSY